MREYVGRIPETYVRTLHNRGWSDDNIVKAAYAGIAVSNIIGAYKYLTLANISENPMVLFPTLSLVAAVFLQYEYAPKFYITQ